MRYIILIFSVTLCLSAVVASGQTPSSDMFDGWGRRNWSLYFENDAINPGNLNTSDANYSQGLRLESLWEPGERTSNVLRVLTLNLASASRKTDAWIYNGTTAAPMEDLDFASACIGDETQYFVLSDSKKKADKCLETVHYSQKNNTPIKVVYDNNGPNELFIVQLIKASKVLRGYTSWPKAIGGYATTDKDLCIIQVLSHDASGSDLLVWFPAEFYENHCFYQHLNTDITEDYFDVPRHLSGVRLPVNMFPNKPLDYRMPATDLAKIQEFNSSQRLNRDGVEILNGYAVGQYIYTPTELVRNSPGQTIQQVRDAIGPGYRPVVGLLFLSVNGHSKRQNTGEYLFTEAKIGLWGNYSYAREVQGAFHAVIGYTDNPIYKYQVRPSFPLFGQYAVNYRKEFLQSSYGLKIGYVVGGDVGTLMANGNAGMLLKVGHFENQRKLKYSYKLTPRNFLGRNFKFFAYAKPTVNVVGMNGLLSSSLLGPRNQEEVDKLLPLKAINPVYLKFEAGFGLRVAEQVTLNYTWVATGPEYDGQPNNMYARLFIRVDY